MKKGYKTKPEATKPKEKIGGKENDNKRSIKSQRIKRNMATRWKPLQNRTQWKKERKQEAIIDALNYYNYEKSLEIYLDLITIKNDKLNIKSGIRIIL